MQTKKEVCSLCAWRENCQKKFSMSGRDIRCPDFSRDLRIKEEKTGSDGEDKNNK